MKRVASPLVLLGLLTFTLNLHAQNATGTWTLYPAQTQTAINQVSVQQPINPDGTSVWSASKGVVPVQFSLSTGFSYGPVAFSSLLSTSSFSYLSFAPNPSLTFDQISSLIANYTFTTGNCHGGLSVGRSVPTSVISSSTTEGSRAPPTAPLLERLPIRVAST